MLFWQDTDSVFMRFECRHPDGTKMTGLDAVRESMRLSIEASNAVSTRLKWPNSLEYEKLCSNSFICIYWTLQNSPKQQIQRRKDIFLLSELTTFPQIVDAPFGQYVCEMEAPVLFFQFAKIKHAAWQLMTQMPFSVVIPGHPVLEVFLQISPKFANVASQHQQYTIRLWNVLCF